MTANTVEDRDDAPEPEGDDEAERLYSEAISLRLNCIEMAQRDTEVYAVNAYAKIVAGAQLYLDFVLNNRVSP